MRSQIWWIEHRFPGQIAIVARPRGGDWLEDEARAWAQSGLDVVVSLLTDEEMFELDIEQEAEMCEAAGLSFINFPIVDRSVPASRNEVLNLANNLRQLLVSGKNIGIHCRQGIGRSALIAAALLISFGKDAKTAFRDISQARNRPVPETVEQENWIGAFAQELTAPVT